MGHSSQLLVGIVYIIARIIQVLVAVCVCEACAAVLPRKWLRGPGRVCVRVLRY